MKYFCKNEARDGTCYHEWIAGAWDGKTVWQDDSLYIHDDVLFETGLGALFLETIPRFDGCGITAVTAEDWQNARDRAAKIGGITAEAFAETEAWAAAALARCGAITMLGI